MSEIFNNDENINWNQEWKLFIDRLNDFILSFQNVKTKEKVIFYRLLSTMTNAWISLVKSVLVLERQEKNPVLKKILVRFWEELRSGSNLSDCLSLYSSSFSDAEIWIIRYWEKTWKLNIALTDLADQIEKVESMTWKIKWAMMYPFFIILVVIWVVSVMMIMVVPKLLEIFDNKDDLPASTKMLIAISDTFVNYWFVMILVVVVSFVFVSIWKKTPNGKYIYDNLMLKIPVFWWINKKIILSKFSRVFSWLLSSWVSVLECLNITSEVVWNEVYRQRLLLLQEDIRQWIRMYESLDWDKLFPEMMIQMIQIWEETAKLDSTILKIADFYDEQVDNTIWILNKLLEPFIIVTLAIIVWFIAVWIMQPIMNLADTISNW